jgi:hypothetical protein
LANRTAEQTSAVPDAASEMKRISQTGKLNSSQALRAPMVFSEADMRIPDVEIYFDEIITPIIRKFEEEPASLRRAFMACVALFHFIDYLGAQPDRDTLTTSVKRLLEGSSRPRVRISRSSKVSPMGLIM